MPTLLRLCKLPVPRSVQGLDFSGYLAGGKDPSDGAAAILCPAPFGQWNFDGNWYPIEHDDHASWRWFFTAAQLHPDVVDPPACARLSFDARLPDGAPRRLIEVDADGAVVLFVPIEQAWRRVSTAAWNPGERKLGMVGTMRTTYQTIVKLTVWGDDIAVAGRPLAAAIRELRYERLDPAACHATLPLRPWGRSGDTE